jgi:LysM repeat protein
VRSSTFRALTGAALTAGLLGATAGTAAADATHEVESGDTLAGIAAQHGDVSWRDLLEANSEKISDPDTIFPGQVLAISDEPVESTHEVESGETLAEIAGLYDHVASWQALADANTDVISDPNLLIPGQVLSLTGAESAPEAQPETQPEPETQAEPQPEPEPEPQPEPQPEPEAQPEAQTESEPEPAPEQSTATDAGVWDRVAECESNGDWSANTGNGYYGGLQFAQSSWEWVGGTGMPHEASKEEQINRAEILLDRQGWDAWPACADQLGLR